MDEITLKAPAKINLFLKILARRPDGYHTIETLFEKIALFDRIKLQKSSRGISVYSENEGLPKDKENLAYKAAQLMKDKYGIPLGIKIEIEKSIPIGAGLGGGSSDAAAVLVGVNRLCDMAISGEELQLLAKDLGADVPFFVSNEIWAVGRERGDFIEGVDTAMKLWHILVIPDFSILSKDAYKWADKGHRKRERSINDILSALKKGDTKLLGKNLYNELEGIALEKEDRLRELKERLVEYGAEGAVVSGSGPALLGITSDETEVMKLKKMLEKEVQTKGDKWQILVAPTLK